MKGSAQRAASCAVRHSFNGGMMCGGKMKAGGVVMKLNKRINGDDMAVNLMQHAPRRRRRQEASL